jgi:DNA polymerase III subunit gamma/tau
MAASSTAPARRAPATVPARRARPATRPGSRSRASGARAARPRSARRAARPARRTAVTPMPARLVPIAVGRTAFAVSGLADSGLVHRLTRGRLWIGALTTLLVGIVSLNVLALSFNASSSRVGTQADALDREISALRAKIATNGASNARVQEAAAKLGLIVPEPGAVGYLRPSPDDAAVAAKRLASGELTAEPSYSAPAAPVTLPITAPSSPPATASPPAAAQPPDATPAADPTGTTTAETTTAPPSPPASPTGGGVSAP